MKALIIQVLLLISLSCFSQSNSDFFTISEKYPRLVGQSMTFRQNNMSTQEGYDVVKKWINFTYNNPNVVIKSEIENEYIRITGSASVCWEAKGFMGLHCFNQNHTLTFEFKNNEIKFQIFQLEMDWLPGTIGIQQDGIKNYNPTYNDMQMSNMRKRKDHTDAATSTLAYLNEYANEIENLIKKSMIMTSDKALAELKRQKDKLDLEIISEAEYDSIKAVLIKYIK